ncbi:unnamed protein product [Tetraodon nigroviridis]|uniref:(spotted green pufferfish) hypothetical protein n=1 Tax=Tetraodon nigroviridis TaxID=99883 RepID=Q4RTL0_TETNG|nr:unnamed protein product [Tetraodon nigroviridis]
MGAGSSTEAEREPLLTPSRADNNTQPVNGRVFRRRWLVLTLFSLLGLLQGMVWNFWGPIQNSAVHAYGFTKADIAVLVLWGPLGFVPWLLFMWLLDKKGFSCQIFDARLADTEGERGRRVPLIGHHVDEHYFLAEWTKRPFVLGVAVMKCWFTGIPPPLRLPHAAGKCHQEHPNRRRPRQTMVGLPAGLGVVNIIVYIIFLWGLLIICKILC